MADLTGNSVGDLNRLASITFQRGWKFGDCSAPAGIMSSRFSPLARVPGRAVRRPDVRARRIDQPRGWPYLGSRSGKRDSRDFESRIELLKKDHDVMHASVKSTLNETRLEMANRDAAHPERDPTARWRQPEIINGAIPVAEAPGISAAKSVAGARIPRAVFASVRGGTCCRPAGHERVLAGGCKQVPVYRRTRQAMEVAL